MAHYTRIRTIGGWAAATTFNPAEAEQMDANLAGAINGDGGGNWSPTTTITLTGVNGLDSRRLRGGDNGSGVAVFDVSGVGVNISADGALGVSGDSTFGGLVEFFNFVDFQDDVQFTGAVTFAGSSLETISISQPVTLEDTFTVVLPGAFITPASRLQFNDNNYPIRLTPPSVNHQVRYGSVVPFTPTTMSASSTSGVISFTNASPLSTHAIVFELLLDLNVFYTSFDIATAGGGGHSGVPATLPTAKLVETSSSGSTVLSTNNINNAASGAAYDTNVVTNLNSFTDFTPSKNSRYLLVVNNEGGANALTGFQVLGIIGNGTQNTVGRNYL